MTYDYVCTRVLCGCRWEREQRITDAPERFCPKCDHETAKRLISGNGAFQLSGSGWAKDGYK